MISAVVMTAPSAVLLFLLPLLGLLPSPRPFLVVEALSSSAAITPPRPTFRAAVYQCRPRPLAPDDGGAGILRSLTDVADALRRASDHDVGLVVFPERFLQGPSAANGAAASVGGGAASAVDREGYELGVVGQLCGELGVSCVLPYAERPHDSELVTIGGGGGSGGGGAEKDEQRKCYSSAVVFHGDGRRAGNYRRTNFPPVHSAGDGGPSAESPAFLRGSHLVESLPFALDLPRKFKGDGRDGGSDDGEGTDAAAAAVVVVKCGVAAGYDLVSSPEHCRQLARTGAELLLVPGSIECGSNSWGERVARRALPARAMENGLHVLCANYEGTPTPTGASSSSSEEASAALAAGSFVGLSAIISPDGEELIRAPPAPAEGGEEEEEEDEGRTVTGTQGSSVIPCEGGELYVCTVDVDAELRRGKGREPCAFVEESVKRWDLTPRKDDGPLPSRRKGASKNDAGEDEQTEAERNASKRGFGSADPKAKKNNRKRKKKYHEVW